MSAPTLVQAGADRGLSETRRSQRRGVVNVGVVVALLLGMIVALAPSGASAEDPTWITNPANGHEYAFINSAGTWQQLEDTAVALGGHLVTINNAAEEAWLAANWPGGRDWAWIGLNDMEVDGEWVWVSGQPVTYVNWSSYTNMDNEDHAFIWFSGSNAGWDDINGYVRTVPWGIVERIGQDYDLALIDVTHESSTVEIGDPLVFEWTVTNLGPGPVPSSWINVQVYIQQGTDPAETTYCRGDVWEGIPVGESRTFTCRQDISIRYGVGEYGGWVNAYALYPDTNDATYDNNTITLPVFSIVDTIAPSLVVPDAITTEAIEPGGAPVEFEATASDVGSGPVSVTCDRASGSTFPLGTTTVTCSATDNAGNTARESFIVTVVDTTLPVVAVPADIVVEAIGPDGAIVAFDASATDNIDGPVAVTCDWTSGSTFPIGTTIVTCSATDASGNLGFNSFAVIVQDTTAPEISSPGDLVAEATGPDGAVVEYAVSAYDLVSGEIPVTCDWTSGSTFPLGMTTVNCSVTDGLGNSRSVTFTVTVQDTTAPVITTPGDLTATPKNASGSTVQYLVTAYDLVDGDVAVTCDWISGSTFPVGMTTVTCWTSDSAGNAAEASFVVTVPLPSEGQGNSITVDACKDGGWATLAPAENPTVPFTSQGECIRFGAQGGTIVELRQP